MIELWCWLFGSCVAATPAPAPSPAPELSLPTEPVVAAPPVPSRKVEPADGTAATGAAPAETSPAPPDTVRLGLALALPAPTPDTATAPAAWQRYAVPAPPADGRPTISVVIDEMGGNAAQSARAVALHGPLTLAWLPSAPQLAAQVAAAARHGHEAMLFMPMEPLGRADLGGGTLRTWLPPAANLAALRAALDQVPSAVALTPPDASVAALSVPLMDLVMGELKARRLAFLDGGELPRGAALARADAAGLASLRHGLSIDADPAPAAIRARLAEAETLARGDGHAVVIGHPRAATLDVLEPYLPALAARGFVLWPISATLAERSGAPAGPDAAGVVPPPERAPAPSLRATASAGEVAVAPAPASGAE